jgi:DUF917 family protein
MKVRDPDCKTFDVVLKTSNKTKNVIQKMLDTWELTMNRLYQNELIKGRFYMLYRNLEHELNNGFITIKEKNNHPNKPRLALYIKSEYPNTAVFFVNGKVEKVNMDILLIPTTFVVQG